MKKCRILQFKYVLRNSIYSSDTYLCFLLSILMQFIRNIFYILKSKIQCLAKSIR